MTLSLLFFPSPFLHSYSNAQDFILFFHLCREKKRKKFVREREGGERIPFVEAQTQQRGSLWFFMADTDEQTSTVGFNPVWKR